MADEWREAREMEDRLREEARRLRDDARRAREEAREEARRAREEAQRLRETAREFGREIGQRLASEMRDRRRDERRGRHGPGSTPPGGWGFGGPPDPDMSAGPRIDEAFSLDGVESVAIDQTAGKLTIRPCAEGETPGATSVGSRSTPRLDVRREGSRLSIDVKQQAGWLLKRRQGATTLVRLGPGIATLRVNLGYGDAQVRDMACESLHIDVGAGTISCYSIRARLDANVGAGKISVHDHVGLAKCDTGTGDLVIDLAELLPGEYRANTGIGRAELRLPAGEKVHIRAASGIGRSRIEYPDAGESAPVRIRVDTGIGEVSVRAREMGKAPSAPPPPERPQRAGRAAQPRRREAEELRVLQLLEQGRISSQEAADLIAALQGAAPPLQDEEGDEPADAAGPPSPQPPATPGEPAPPAVS
jgi:hypothetical protein